MIGTLKLSTNFARFGFVVPRGGYRRYFGGRVAPLHRSGRTQRADGLMVAHDRTTTPDTRIAASNTGVAE